jgi:hypothetical protein
MVLVLALGAVLAVSGTTDGGYPSADLLLYNLTSSPSPHLKIQAMNALSMRRDTRARDAILSNTNSPYLDVRLNALRSLGRYHDPADLRFFENIILDYEGQYTVQERIVAIKSYVNIKGWNPVVLEEAQMMADDPVEGEVLKRALLGESLSLIPMR